MCGLMIGLLLPHGEGITLGGYGYNLALATLGNILGGAVFVGGAYWLGSPKARAASAEVPARTNDGPSAAIASAEAQ
jgi:nitrite transporter NirC